ncbi:hypothetical protein AARAC_006163 [Aspergillus arachidicola]|uniref:Tc1-like transposase DDE domain-containing protein n=1 Tax=Aspergillus arachidicola TaxID=656916 RepID=A0A2G7EMI0_9EURO|nr:hypothetical protein AARAC_006163 [Aspergillus arachidicola]
MGIRVMVWPPYSPDLNPIENLWALMKEEIYKLYPELAHADDSEATRQLLIQAAKEAWQAIEQRILVRLSQTMPHRVKAVIEARGCLESRDPAHLANLDAEDIQPILFTSTIDGGLENVRRLVTSPGGKSLKPEFFTSARLIAAEKGSLGIAKLLAPPDEMDVPREIIKAAAISNAGPGYDFKLMKFMLGTKESPERRSETTKISYKRLPASMLIDKIFRAPVFNDIHGSVLKETRLQHTLEMLKEHHETFMLRIILVRLASSSCTLSIANQLLSYGARMDHPLHTYTWDGIHISAGSGMTAPQWAAKKTTKDAALLMQLLVLGGAETDWRGIEDKPGAKKIGEFIGVEWADLLRQAPPKVPFHSRSSHFVDYMDVSREGT